LVRAHCPDVHDAHPTDTFAGVVDHPVSVDKEVAVQPTAAVEQVSGIGSPAALPVAVHSVQPGQPAVAALAGSSPMQVTLPSAQRAGQDEQETSVLAVASFRHRLPSPVSVGFEPLLDGSPSLHLPRLHLVCSLMTGRTRLMVSDQTLHRCACGYLGSRSHPYTYLQRRTTAMSLPLSSHGPCSMRSGCHRLLQVSNLSLV
jgi:hypothetical protein